MDKARPFNALGETSWTGSELVSTLVDLSKLFIFAYSPRLNTLVSWSRNSEEILGVKDLNVTREGDLFLRYVHPEDRFWLLNKLEGALKSGAEYRVSYRWVRPDNREQRLLHCRAKLCPMSWDKSEPLLQGVILDMSDELGALSLNLAHDALESLHSRIILLDRDLCITLINRGLEQIACNFGDNGFNAAALGLGKQFLSCFADLKTSERWRNILSDICEGKLKSYSENIAGGEKISLVEVNPLIENGSISGAILTVSDATDAAAREKELGDLRKRETARSISSTLVNNLNNALQTVAGYSAALQQQADDPEFVKRMAELILQAVRRGSDLHKRLADFDDSLLENDEPAELNSIILESVRKYQTTWRGESSLSFSFGSPPKLGADRQQILSILEKLLRALNSIENFNSKVSVKTSQISINRSEISNLEAGTYAKLAIEYSTNKNVLSESLVLNDLSAELRAIGGALILSSSSNSEATIALYFPSSERAASPPLENNSDAPEILIVDDDPLVLGSLRPILSQAGYSVVFAAKSSEALGLATRYQHSLRLALVDAVMPGSNPPKLIRKLLRTIPGIKILGFSGAASRDTALLVEAGALSVIHKPADPQTLRTALAEALNGKKAA